MAIPNLAQCRGIAIPEYLLGKRNVPDVEWVKDPLHIIATDGVVKRMSNSG